MNEDNKVTDDWTKNWDASVAVKISAVVLWLLVVVCLASIAYQLSSLKTNLLTSKTNEADQIAYRIGKVLSQSAHTKTELKNELNKLITEFNFVSFDIQVGNKHHKIGNFSKSLELYESRNISFHTSAEKFKSSGGYGRAQINTYSIPIQEIIKSKRRDLIVITIFILLSFSLILTWIINRIVTRPIKHLVEATQSISEGKLDTRLILERHDEFGQLAGFFNNMLDTLKNKQDELQFALRDANAATIAKSEFLANMSHEIRTPLTAITGFSKTLLDENLEPKTRKLAICSIIRNGAHLKTIINDILDLSKIEAHKLDINKHPFSLFKLLADIEALSVTQVSDKGLRFKVKHSFPLPEKILNDEIRVKQVLINLCSNAIKFTEEGEVSINVSFNKPENKLIFAVKDSGIGLTEEQIERIFSPFTQADSTTTRTFGGTGLGLSISRQLADLLGGSLEVESVKNLGSCFTFSIDPGVIAENNFTDTAPEQDAYSIQDDGKIIKNSVQGNILLVEDTPDNQLLISYYLKTLGANVTLADNGQLALNETEKNTFDLILMDMQMPVMGGVEAVKILRKRGYSQPIAMLTANAMNQFEEECRAAGCDDFLVKPIDLNSLCKVVGKYLKPRENEMNGLIKAEAQQPLSNTPVEALYSTLYLDEPEFNELVNNFIDNLPNYITDLEQAVDNKDDKLISSITHSLKGISGNYGFPPLSQLLVLIEEHVDEKQYDKINNALNLLRKVAERIYLGKVNSALKA